MDHLTGGMTVGQTKQPSGPQKAATRHTQPTRTLKRGTSPADYGQKWTKPCPKTGEKTDKKREKTEKTEGESGESKEKGTEEESRKQENFGATGAPPWDGRGEESGQRREKRAKFTNFVTDTINNIEKKQEKADSRERKADKSCLQEYGKR